MEPIEAIEDDKDLSRLINPLAAPAVAPPSDLVDQIDRLQRLQAIGDEARILADAAESLYAFEIEELEGVMTVNVETPDDDRAGGRMDFTRLDLLSE